MEEFDDLERVGFFDLGHCELEGDESSDKAARDAKMGCWVTVDDKVGGSRALEVQVRDGGYDVDGTPRGFYWLPVEFKVVEVAS